jgi:hypothetical protein
VTAKDEAGNAGSKTVRVLLDNWTQVLKAEQVGVGAGTISVKFTGQQWTANATVKIYLMSPFPFIAENSTISQTGTLLVNATTDANGNINAVTLDVPHPGGGEFPGYFLADYHGGDDKYQPRLDAITYLQEDSPPIDPLWAGDGPGGGMAADFASAGVSTPALAPAAASPPKSAVVTPSVEPPPAVAADLPVAEPVALAIHGTTGSALFGAFDLLGGSEWDEFDRF